jgi:hypothetical protein
MKRSQDLRYTAATVFSLGAFLTGSVLASISTGPDPDDRSRQDLIASATPEGATAPASARYNERTIQIAGSNREIHLWNQVGASGTMTPRYAIMERNPGDSAPSIVGRERETSYNVGLRYASFDPLRATPGVNAQLLAPANNELFLVQMWAVPLDEMRAQIEAMGGTVHRFLEDHTYIVRMPAGVAQNVQALDFVRWVGPFHAAYKLDETIISAFVKGFPGGGVEGSKEGYGEWFTTGEYSIEVFERAGAAPVIDEPAPANDAGVVPQAPERASTLQPGDLGQQAIVKRAIEAMGGSVSVTTPGGFRMQAHLTPAQLIQVAKLNEVHFIDPWGMGGGDMNNVRLVGGANALESATGMSGENVRAEVFDSELRTTHTEFVGVPIILHDGVNPASPHGTSVFSIMFARGASSIARGLLPDAQAAYFYHYRNSSQFGGAKSRLAIANESVLNDVVIQTSSIGSPRITTYTTISAEMDDVIFQSLLLHTQSQSNAGSQNSRPQAWSKNIVSGGAVNHENNSTRADDNWSFGASIGPAADGRIKPDLCFFYDFTRAASNGSNTSYTEFGGTSGATPSIGGYMGLFHQMWHENTWQGSGRLNAGGGTNLHTNRPNPMLPKAALINSAFRYNWNSGGPNADIDRFKQGWGMPNVDALYDLRAKTYYADEPFLLRQGQSKTHTIKVAANEPNLNVTMVYMDLMGTTSATTHRINDLSLRVTSPSGTSYWGNNGLTADNTSSAGGTSNTKDTVENVFVVNPEAGQWTVEVMADVVVQDSHVETAARDADYALWVTGGTESTSIKTTFRGGNGQSGFMFDLGAQTDIDVTGFDVSCDANTTVEVYWTPTTYVGKETNAAAWTLLGSDAVTANGVDAATRVNVGGLGLKAGESVGIYITDNTGTNLNYTNGSETWDNGEVTVSAGVGNSYPFGSTFTPRSGNAIVYYDVIPPVSGVGPYAFSIRSNADDQLYRIDLLTGEVQSMGAAMGFGDAEGMTMMPDGSLLAIGGSVDELWNVTSPPGSLIGATGARTGSDAGLDYSEAGRALYNLNGQSGASSLYRVNPNNGSVALVGNSTIFADNIAIDKNGRAYAIDGVFTDSLYSVDLTNGSLKLIGSLALGNISAQFGSAFLGDTLYALASTGDIYTINTTTGAATLQASTGNLSGWEGLAIPCSVARFMPTEAFGSTFSNATRTRGYWFKAPTDFLITGLRVPDESGAGVQNVEVVRFDSPVSVGLPGANNFVSLFRAVDVNNNSVIQTAIPVGVGDIIGILGAAGTAIMENSYGTNNEVPISIFGQPATAKRMGMQFNLNGNVAQSLWTENSGPISRVEMYYTDVPDIKLDADSVATGSTLDTTPLVTSLGTISATGTVEIRATADPDLALAGSGGNVMDTLAPAAGATMKFDFDVNALTFVYGGNGGEITVTARDAANNIVDQFFQADTGNGLPAGPQTLAGKGIRSLTWKDPSGNFAPLDNIKILGIAGPQCPPCACEFDTSTGPNVCDIFDFLAFQNGFVAGDPCAIDLNTSTGNGVGDIFDFLDFQNSFVGGPCP